GQAVLHRVEHLGRVAVPEALVVDDDVGGQHGQDGGDGVRVQLVHVEDVVELLDVPAYVVQVEVLRRGLQQHVARVAQQPQRPGQDDEPDRHGDQRVGVNELGQRDDPGSDQHSDRGGGVG